MRASIGSPPRFFHHATRTSLKVRSSGPAKRLPGSASEMGDRGSGPAIALSTSATSATLRAIGPSTLSVDHAVGAGQTGTRPGEGRRPTTLQKLAGLRSEPPISEPSAIGSIPHASAAAAPPLLPPQVLVTSYGLTVVPNTRLKVCDPAANSGMFVLPTMIAPAFLTRSPSSES